MSRPTEGYKRCSHRRCHTGPRPFGELLASVCEVLGLDLERKASVFSPQEIVKVQDEGGGGALDSRLL